jgi:hypothetical protein
METVVGAAAEQPVHDTVTVKFPPAGCGGSRAFHDASGADHGLNGGLMSAHDAHGRTPQSGPNVCCVAFSVARTVVGAPPPSGDSVTLTIAPAFDAATSRKP